MTRSGGRLPTPATQRKAAPRSSAEARGAFSTAAGWRARLRGCGLWEAKHPRAGKGHPEWVGGKPPAAVGGCRWLGGCRGCVVPRLTADVSGRVEGTASGLWAVGGKNVR